MDELKEYGYINYEEFRARLGSELQKEAESFVRIGYLLKVARDSEVLAGSGYGTVAEFAAAEYGLSKDVVSRYIAINDRYSEGGYSEELQERYRKYGYAKLSEMLTLPQVVVDAVPLDATREEIRELKRELREEEQVTPMELALEAEAPADGGKEVSLFGRMLREYYHGKPEEYERLHEAVRLRLELYGELPEADVMDILAPSGNVVMVARIGGVGRVMLIVKDSGRPELLAVRTGEKTVHDWSEVREEFIALAADRCVEDSWRGLYGEKFPLAEALQQEKSGKAGQAIRVSRPAAGPAGPGRKGKNVSAEKGKKAVQRAGKTEQRTGKTEQTPGKAGRDGQVADAEEPGTEEAGRLLGVIRDALERENLMTARRAARMLAELLDRLCEKRAAADMDGQMDIREFLDAGEQEAGVSGSGG